jgi:extracellular elastinolytic metalloproteinase
MERTGSRLLAVAGAAAVALAAAGVARAGDSREAEKRDRYAHFDVRAMPAAQKTLAKRAAELAKSPPAAAAALEDELGVEGVVKLDPLTGTVKQVARTDGFLTRPSKRPAAEIAAAWLADNRAALGLTPETLATLELARDYVSIDGTHHLFYRQVIDGIAVFGQGVKVNVTKDGRIVNVAGSPVVYARIAAAAPALTAAGAIVAARVAVEAPLVPLAPPEDEQSRRAHTDRAKLVLFQDVAELRLAYQTYLADAGYLSVVDARTGDVLYRSSTARFANGAAWRNRPGAARGGVQEPFDLNGPAGSWRYGRQDPFFGRPMGLSSESALVIADANASRWYSTSELVQPKADGSYAYAFTPFEDAVNSPCSAAYPCSWSSRYPDGSYSWQVNRNQNATQVYWFLNTFHDHLAAAPIGFTVAAGNFEEDDAVGDADRGDPWVALTDFGANTLRVGGSLVGLPVFYLTDNAGVLVPPDGFYPEMFLMLFNTPEYNPPFAPGPAGSFDPFVQANSGDDASVVYHEYAHGLSHRLVVDGDGNSALESLQSWAIDEGTSDWYAYDYLVAEGLVADAPGVADIVDAEYLSRGESLFRTEPLDCKIGSTDPACDGDPDGSAGTGGYTLGDFARIIGWVEAHADGEIWMQTLWDLRDALGSAKCRGLLTRALELSAPNPSFLDMRNAILQADVVATGGADHRLIWEVFARRGMGFYAASLDGMDLSPAEDFSLPPLDAGFGKLKGTVADADSGRPVEGAAIVFGGHSTGFASDIVDVTGADGAYDIKRVLTGTYPKVAATAFGYDPVVREVTVDHRANHLDWKLRRNWALYGAGASIAGFSGMDFPICPPESAIDGTVIPWLTNTDDGDSTGRVVPKYVVVELPVAVDVTEVALDPSAEGCGAPADTSTRGYRVQASRDGSAFATVAEGVFTTADNGRLNRLTLNGALDGVRYLRLWLLSPQVPGAASDDPDDDSGVAAHCGPGKDNAYSGCWDMGLTELKVYGRVS